MGPLKRLKKAQDSDSDFEDYDDDMDSEGLTVSKYFLTMAVLCYVSYFLFCVWGVYVLFMVLVTPFSTKKKKKKMMMEMMKKREWKMKGKVLVEMQRWKSLRKSMRLFSVRSCKTLFCLPYGVMHLIYIPM